ncbi:MAG: N-acetyltransferase [Chloroflexota bacterium]
MVIRNETEQDWDAIAHVNRLAFGQENEAQLVNALRKNGKATISLVAEDRGEVVGHILFSLVTVGDNGTGIALGPLAVHPDWQKQGVGSQLTKAGIVACRRLGFSRLIVLGHPTYYPRFGFVPASRFGVHSEYKVPDEVFMAQELTTGAFNTCSGLVKYAPEFQQFS